MWLSNYEVPVIAVGDASLNSAENPPGGAAATGYPPVCRYVSATL